MINTDRSTLYRLDMLNQQQLKVNHQMSTGDAIDKGSDDTQIYTQELYIEDKLNVFEGLKRQIEKTSAQNDVSDSTLAEIKNLLDFIKTETIKGRNDTSDPISRNAIATQIEGAKENLFKLVNERVEDEYIFSGSQTNVQAFVQDQDGKITYNGNPNLRESAVEIDSYRDRGVTGFEMMSYSVSTTVSGQEVSFKEGERIIDENGDEWKLNAAQTVLVRYDEDGKATKDFVEVTTTGDSPDKVHTIAEVPTNEDGSEKIFNARHNSFQAIDDAIAALRNNDGDAISLALDDLNNAYDAANTAHGELGGRNKTFETAYERVTSKLTHFNVLSIENSSADMTKVAIESKQLELIYKTLYSTISKTNSLSLVNYLS
ncbi:MAG: flagellar hook-associated protein 3 [Arcobacter sp.]|uniref:flagellar hook-associated protein FlgL n=1 Tax=uncultured Arcobacter sp. TaxID=165434 RepID=UPI000CC3B756|nr:flagellar hook-associated protein FlgL [uncultured Arcobacter sp.]PLY10405.1 MAG: flagellar hook-associated protein 3 [Arcobacter sp.]